MKKYALKVFGTGFGVKNVAPFPQSKAIIFHDRASFQGDGKKFSQFARGVVSKYTAGI